MTTGKSPVESTIPKPNKAKEKKVRTPPEKRYINYYAETPYDSSKGARLVDALFCLQQAVGGANLDDVVHYFAAVTRQQTTVHNFREWYEAWSFANYQRRTKSYGNKQPPAADYDFSTVDGIMLAYGLPGRASAGQLFFASDADGRPLTATLSSLPSIHVDRVLEVVGARWAEKEKAEAAYRAENVRENRELLATLETMWERMTGNE